MTTDRDGNRSNPYKPNPDMCCEACTFRNGEHARWCDRFERPAPVMVQMPDGLIVALRKLSTT